jgi:GMP synthase-like glutamine amidotransferase
MVNTAEEDERVVLTADVGPESPAPIEELHLCCLGCEDSPPYGPTQHTAQLFLNLIVSALTQEYPHASYRIKISVYRCQQLDYPTDYSVFHGILLPGSFSGAYEEDKWIERLKLEIATIIYPQSIPTFGVCFGHQVYAHALEGGRATKCPAGPQTGCKGFDCTEIGTAFMSEDGSASRIELLYTHGDMVESLPWCAKSLGGNESVPIQAAVYYSDSNRHTVAVTVQAHPEYAGSSLGYEGTFLKTLRKREKRGNVADIQEAERNASDKLETIKNQSVMVMIMAGKRLGWFA